MFFFPRRCVTAFMTLSLIMTSYSTVINALDTLYDFSEPISQFTMDNFTQNVALSDTAWVVEFYASWCGHCQKLAPVWVNLARDIQGWHNVVRVGSVSCSDPVNAPLCRFYNIYSYPSIKFFSKNTSLVNKGFNYQGNKTVDAMRDAIALYLAAIPMLQPYRRAQDILDRAPEGLQFAFVITVDHRNSTELLMAYQVILDTSQFSPSAVVGWMNYFASRAHGVLDLPAFHRLEWDGSLNNVILADVNRRTVAETVRSYLHRPTEIPLVATTPFIEDEQKTQPQYAIPSGIHMQDLESGLYYSLWMEVAAQPILDPVKQGALLKHLSLIYKYIPFKEPILLFLNRTITWLSTLEGDITGEQWLDFLNRAQSSDAYVPNEIRWAGCMGTLPKFRGYPCSVWTTYHTLTVAAYLKGATDPDFNPQEVLLAMRGYVGNFLGCRRCADHFVDMASDIESRVIGSYDGVLWLWTAHNKVNNRLQGDDTEDPNHPKVQFPSYEACPDCRIDGSSNGLFDNDTTWNIGKVIGYLTRFYDPLNLMDDIIDPEEDGDYSYADMITSEEERLDSGGSSVGGSTHHDGHGGHQQKGQGDEYQGRVQQNSLGQPSQIQYRERPTSTEPVLRMDDKQALRKKEEEEESSPSGEAKTTEDDPDPGPAVDIDPYVEIDLEDGSESYTDSHDNTEDRENEQSVTQTGMDSGDSSHRSQINVERYRTNDRIVSEDMPSQGTSQTNVRLTGTPDVHSEPTHGRSGSTREHSGSTHGHSGSTNRHSGSTHGSSAETHGHSGSTNRHSDPNRQDNDRLPDTSRSQHHSNNDHRRQYETRRIGSSSNLNSHSRSSSSSQSGSRHRDSGSLYESRRIYSPDPNYASARARLSASSNNNHHNSRNPGVSNSDSIPAHNRQTVSRTVNARTRSQYGSRPTHNIQVPSDVNQGSAYYGSNSNRDPIRSNPDTRRRDDSLWNNNRYTRYLVRNSRRRTAPDLPTYRDRSHPSMGVQSAPLSLDGSSSSNYGNRRGLSAATGRSTHLRSNRPNVAYVERSPCVLRATAWTPCSLTCDTGTSSRYTNYNDQCEMRQETRLCQLRPCEAHLPDWSRMDWHRQRCPQFGSTYRDASPRALRQGNCETRERRMWRYCGMCPTKCCYPLDTRTITMDMICDDGTQAVVKVMAYDHCNCESTCPMYY